jgi:hypothetical protein
MGHSTNVNGVAHWQWAMLWSLACNGAMACCNGLARCDDHGMCRSHATQAHSPQPKRSHRLSPVVIAAMPTTDLLRTFGLYRNPFIDRTAEKTNIDPLCEPLLFGTYSNVAWH